MMRVGPLLALGALLMLAGCNQDDQGKVNQNGSAPPLEANLTAIPEAENVAIANAEPVRKVAHVDSAAGSERFTCDNGASVIVTYGEDSAALLINGEAYELPAVAAASGSKYRSETGMTEGKSLAWWSEGNRAALTEAPIDRKSGDKDVVQKCKLAADATSQPDIG